MSGRKFSSCHSTTIASDRQTERLVSQLVRGGVEMATVWARLTYTRPTAYSLTMCEQKERVAGTVAESNSRAEKVALLIKDTRCLVSAQFMLAGSPSSGSSNQVTPVQFSGSR